MKQQRIFIVQTETTLLPFLLEHVKGISRNSVKNLLTRRQVMVDGQVITRHDHVLKPAMKVEVLAAGSRAPAFPILYEDDDILVINKSPFMAMHPTHNHQGDTLANAVAGYLSSKGKYAAFRAVGRLDKGTSGVVVCALNKLSAAKLSGEIKKEYVALVKGELDGSGTVDVPMYRPDPMKTLRACSYELGVEEALTHWTVEKKFRGATLIRLNLETGRTHQIRVHMAFSGHPLAGDDMYGDFMTEIGHQLLHCRKCSFIHPVTQEKMELEAPLFEDFANALKSE